MRLHGSHDLAGGSGWCAATSSTTNIAHVEGGVATTATTPSLNFAIGVLTVALEVSCLDNVCLCVRVFGLCDA